MTPAETIVPEFSVVVSLDSIGDEPRRMEISAGGEERSALSRRFGLVSIEKFASDLVLAWIKPGKVLSLKGRISANVTQSCVVTLDPVAAEVDEEVDIVFSKNPEQTADIIDPNEAETLEGEEIDVGEIVSEELSLALDPYPRRADIDPESLKLGPGARLMSEEAAGDEARESRKKDNPFNVLSALKPKN
tara:strand:+ start:6719 stop:7288 length:570 start_codon:yes stop_codon:yes gene_type:complete